MPKNSTSPDLSRRPDPPPAPPRKVDSPQRLPKSAEEMIVWQKAMLVQAVELLEDFRAEAKRDREERAREAEERVKDKADYERQEYNACLRIFAAEALSGLVEREVSAPEAADCAFNYAREMYRRYMELKRNKA